MKKFELTTDFITFCGVKLFRIRALIEFDDVKAGDVGGYIEEEKNLSQLDDAWVYGNAKVYGNAEVYCDAKVFGNAEVYGNAKVYGNAWVYGNAKVYDDAWVYGNAKVYGNAEVYCDAKVFDDAWVYGNAKVCGDAWVYGNALVFGNAWVYGNAWTYGDAWVCGDALVCDDADYATIKGFGKICRTTTFFREKDRIAVRCGCFYGGLDDFREKVKETHKDSKMGKEYLMIADLMEYHFKKEEE